MEYGVPSPKRTQIYVSKSLNIYKFFEVLKTNGLTQTEVKIGDIFDADLHEAITQISTPGEDDKGKVIDIVEVGYQLGDRIIRYPKVVVGQ